MKAVLWMLGALASFCLMAVAAREVGNGVSTIQVLFFRSVIGLLVVSLIIISLKRLRLFSTARIKQHTSRNIFHFAGQYGWFLGITLLPLAEVFALEFTVPLWTLIIAVLFLGEKLTLKKCCAVLLGLAGVYIIVQPGSELFDKSSLIVLAAAVSYGIAHSTTKALSSTEDPLTVLFYMCLIQLPIGFIFAVMDWQTPNSIQWLWIFIIGITALTANYCVTKAMQYAEVTTVMTLDFLRLPLISIVGVILYQEGFEITLIIGGLLMLFGNLLNLYRRK